MFCSFVCCADNSGTLSDVFCSFVSCADNSGTLSGVFFSYVCCADNSGTLSGLFCSFVLTYPIHIMPGASLTRCFHAHNCMHYILLDIYQ